MSGIYSEMRTKEDFEAYNEAYRYMEWETYYKPRDENFGDNRTPLQRRLDKLSLADAWNLKTSHALKMKVEAAASFGYEDDEYRDAKVSLLSEGYKAGNPYQNDGDKIFVGDYILDEYSLLSRYEGWYQDGHPIITLVAMGRKTVEESWDIARENGKRLFGRAGKVYTEIDLLRQAIAS